MRKNPALDNIRMDKTAFSGVGWVSCLNPTYFTFERCRKTVLQTVSPQKRFAKSFYKSANYAEGQNVGFRASTQPTLLK